MLSVVSPAYAGDGTTFRGDAAHTGVYAGSGVRLMTVGSILSSPVVDGNEVYFGSTDGNVYAVSVKQS